MFKSSPYRFEYLNQLKRKKPSAKKQPKKSSNPSSPPRLSNRPPGERLHTAPPRFFSQSNPGTRQESIVSAVIAEKNGNITMNDSSDCPSHGLLESNSTPQLGDIVHSFSHGQNLPMVQEITLNLDQTPERHITMTSTSPAYFSAGARAMTTTTTMKDNCLDYQAMQNHNSLYPSPVRQYGVERSTISRSAFTDALEYEADGLRSRIRVLSMNESKLQELLNEDRRRVVELERNIKIMRQEFQVEKERLQGERDRQMMKRSQLQKQLFRLFEEDEDARRNQIEMLKEENKVLKEQIKKLKVTLLVEQMVDNDGTVPGILKHWGEYGSEQKKQEDNIRSEKDENSAKRQLFPKRVLDTPPQTARRKMQEQEEVSSDESEKRLQRESTARKERLKAML